MDGTDYSIVGKILKSWIVVFGAQSACTRDPTTVFGARSIPPFKNGRLGCVRQFGVRSAATRECVVHPSLPFFKGGMDLAPNRVCLCG